MLQRAVTQRGALLLRVARRPGLHSMVVKNCFNSRRRSTDYANVDFLRTRIRLFEVQAGVALYCRVKLRFYGVRSSTTLLC